MAWNVLRGAETMTEHQAVIVSAVRTPTGKFLGALAQFQAPELGAFAIKEAVKRAGIDPSAIDEVVMGNVVSAGIGQAPARQAAVKAGLAVEIPAFTARPAFTAACRAGA